MYYMEIQGMDPLNYAFLAHFEIGTSSPN